MCHKEKTYVPGGLDRKEQWYFNWVEDQTAVGGGFWGYKFWTQEMYVKQKPNTSLYLGETKVLSLPMLWKNTSKICSREKIRQNVNK